MKKLIKYPVIIDGKIYTVTIKEIRSNTYPYVVKYIVRLYKGKYEILNFKKFEKMYIKEIYKYNLIDMVKLFINNYKYEQDKISRENKAIKDFKDWDGILDN